MNKERIKKYCDEAGIDLLVLFGSSADGDARADSDVDIAVKMRRGASASKLDLIYDLGSMMGEREIDLVVLSSDTDPVLLFEVFSRGKLLYESRPDCFAEEQLRACRRYFDSAKLRRLRSEYVAAFSRRARSVA